MANVKKPITEGIIDKFIDSFIDSYKKGIEKQFIQKSKERSPILAKGLENTAKQMDDIVAYLKKLDAQNPKNKK
jgi:hypothetical protein